MIAQIVVEGQSLRWYGRVPTIADNSVKFVKFQFMLSPDWEGYDVTAQFTQDENTYNQLVDDGYCDMPAELGTGNCSVSLFGYKAGEVNRATVVPLYFVIQNSGFVPDGETPIPPTPDLYAQLLSEVKTSETEAKGAATAAGQFAASASNAASNAALSAKTAEDAEGSAKQAAEDASNRATDAESAKQAAEDAAAEARQAADSITFPRPSKEMVGKAIVVDETGEHYTLGEAGIKVSNTAKVGQTVRVTEVDEEGKPVAWEATEFPKELYIGKYGVSTHEELQNAYFSQGKSVAVLNGTALYFWDYMSSNYTIFFTKALEGEIRTLYVTPSNKWSTRYTSPLTTADVKQEVLGSQNPVSSAAVLNYAQPKGAYLVPPKASIGQLLVVQSVDDEGIPIQWAAVDLPFGKVDDPDSTVTLLSEAYMEDSTLGYWDGMEELFLFEGDPLPEPIRPGKTYLLEVDGNAYTAEAQISDNWGTHLDFGDGSSLYYDPNGLKYFEEVFLAYSPSSDWKEPNDNGSDLIPHMLSLYTKGSKIIPIGIEYLDIEAIKEALPSVELIATLEDGTTTTLKLLGEVVT